MRWTLGIEDVHLVYTFTYCSVGIEVRLWKLIIQERACTSSDCVDSPASTYHKPIGGSCSLALIDNNNTLPSPTTTTPGTPGIKTKIKKSESEYDSCSE